MSSYSSLVTKPFNQESITTIGSERYVNPVVQIKQNHIVQFRGTITAVIQATSSCAMWKFNGAIKRENTLQSTKLVGLASYAVIANNDFKQSYIEIYANTTEGTLEIATVGLENCTIIWTTTIEIGDTI
ncbi:hypothetical protein EBS67_00240 [bacterium]|nr:hypothetical protein [bacterium]